MRDEFDNNSLALLPGREWLLIFTCKEPARPEITSQHHSEHGTCVLPASEEDSLSDHALGSTTRPYNELTFAEACQRIAAADYSDVAVFAHKREMPVDSSSSADQVAAARHAAAAGEPRRRRFEHLRRGAGVAG